MNSFEEEQKRFEEKGHELLRDEDGRVDWFYVDTGFHNGPKCVKCKESWCHHCLVEVPPCKGKQDD